MALMTVNVVSRCIRKIQRQSSYCSAAFFSTRGVGVYSVRATELTVSSCPATNLNTRANDELSQMVARQQTDQGPIM